MVTIFYLLATGGINSQDTHLPSAKENFPMMKCENLHDENSEQRDDVEQPVKHVDISKEVVVPPGGKIPIVIICSAV